MLGRIGGEMRRLMADPGLHRFGVAPRRRRAPRRSPVPVLREAQEISGLLRP